MLEFFPNFVKDKLRQRNKTCAASFEKKFYKFYNFLHFCFTDLCLLRVGSFLVCKACMPSLCHNVDNVDNNIEVIPFHVSFPQLRRFIICAKQKLAFFQKNESSFIFSL